MEKWYPFHVPFNDPSRLGFLLEIEHIFQMDNDPLSIIRKPPFNPLNKNSIFERLHLSCGCGAFKSQNSHPDISSYIHFTCRIRSNLCWQ
jgi:hypothetical protein